MSFQHIPLRPDAIIPTPRAQRRATVRYRCPPATLGRVFIAESYKSIEAWLLNLSVEGTGLLMNQCLDPGTWVFIELESTNQKLCLELSARVAHATRQHDGSWMLGCAFGNPLSADELEALL
jgi:hypothetical protein